MIKVDPVTVEVIQNRLLQIGREAGLTLIRTAASPVVVESKDLGFNIADHLGRPIVYSVWMPRHGTTLTYMIRSTMDRFANAGINEGDAFLTNDPHAGSLHVSDIAVIAPVHWKGEIIAWTGCATHHLDVGGMVPGFCPTATDWFQEGIKFPPMKLLEGGTLRQDVFDLFLRNVRMPRFQGLDLMAQVAANNVARAKLLELIGRYGVDVLKTCYEEIIDFSEKKTRARISKIPEGTYEYEDVLDYDKAYRLKCALTVKDSTLTFDFTGTDPQSGCFINSAVPCTVANVHNIITCMLIPDVPANEGCFRPIKMVLPPKTLLSCEPPAPCSGASILGGWKAQCLAVGVLSKALAASEEKWRVNANWGWGMAQVQFSGLDQQRRFYTLTMMDGCLHGGGARATKDGIDVSNIPGSTTTSIPNVEHIEHRYPLLYLTRHLCTDSEGAGRFRGGLAGEYVITPHDTDRVETVAFCMGKDFGAEGVEGGCAGTRTSIRLWRNTQLSQTMAKEVPDLDSIEGEKTELPQQNQPFTLHPNDVLLVRCMGGGGFGPPGERDPELVRHDLAEGYISKERAKEVYGLEVPE